MSQVENQHNQEVQAHRTNRIEKCSVAKTKQAKVKRLRQEKAERMSQNASSYSHHISGKGSSSGSPEIEYCGQDAKNGFNPVPDMPQGFLDAFRPLFFLILFSQG